MLGYMEASFLTERFDGDLFTLTELRAALERAHVDYTGWPFLYLDRNTSEATYTIQDGWEAAVHTKDFNNHDLIEFWQFRQSGFFYHRTTLRPSVIRKDQNIILVADLKEMAMYVAQAIDCMIRLHNGLTDDDQYVAFLVRILNTENRVLVNSRGGMPLWNSYTCHIPVIVC